MQAVVNIEYFNIIIDYKQWSWEIKLSLESCSDPAFNNEQYTKKIWTARFHLKFAQELSVGPQRILIRGTAGDGHAHVIFARYSPRSKR